ncbi:MAG TPA: glutaredoxin domain-containing protein [Polyangia bacterium]|jgi:arsenate reductase-like glutaredoxin family protein|nr:glutaredoxin domain-containing protein [Polyangia bacterium]
MRSGLVRRCLLTALLGAIAACHRAAPDLPPAAPGAPATIEVLKGGRWLFTYAEPAGTFSTTDKPETIPAEARGLVRVIEPNEQMKGGADRVYVTNVGELVDKGKSSAKAMSREAFETAALAALPGGQSSPFAAQQMAPAPMPAPATAPTTPPGGTAPPGTTPVVTIYGTSWCGACRAAREYMAAHKIPFADKDIERDPAAARELADKASKMGIPTDRVPIIDVRGRLLLGFDRERIEALLGQPT